MESKFGSMTIPELRNELRKRNARVSGRKSDLVERLVAYDRNQNFGQPDTLEPEYIMSVPDPGQYSDINSDSKFSDLELEEINRFLQKCGTELDSHIRKFYDERLLRYVRISNQDDIFFKANCHAEMKRGISYTSDIKMNREGLILESQCECAAGMGPVAHCKHICLVLYGIAMFSKSKSLKTEETCTQKLQTFHKSKKFVGSPLKASSLELPGAADITNIHFDPRPVAYRNMPSYQDYFRNSCLNFPGISSLPIFQTFEPANMHAIANDHQYFEQTHEENFLELCKISKISEDDVQRIERKTVGQNTNAIVREERAKRLTSSMFGRICKATLRTNKMKLARSLTSTKIITAAPLEHGLKHEHVAIQRFSVDKSVDIKPCGMFISKCSPFMCASPDGIINETHIIEIKCPYVHRDKDISPQSVPYLKEDSSGHLYLHETHDYFYQIQGQLFCTGAKVCTLIICTADKLKIKDIKYINIYRNDEFISKMHKELEDFYEKFFKNAILEKFFYKSIE